MEDEKRMRVRVRVRVGWCPLPAIALSKLHSIAPGTRIKRIARTTPFYEYAFL